MERIDAPMLVRLTRDETRTLVETGRVTIETEAPRFEFDVADASLLKWRVRAGYKNGVITVERIDG